ncbi:unnamed protein product [Owenia fusiformis]|uniref:Beta-lactamase-related domain-containing protein n=1 Tax=Owenia fusiformis TaxID=6347 RepID=A0A8S4N2K8_OWEFU|nr:unnamed protein product [Owenia fusiformis]
MALSLNALSSVILMLLTKTRTTTTEGFTEREIQELDSFTNNLLTCRGIPGLALSVVRGRDVLLTKGYGVTDVYSKLTVTENSTFCIGSITKGFTATILAMLIAENKSLTWDTRIRDIMGNSFHLADEERTNQATIRDLLAHKLGIPGYFGALMSGMEVDRKELVSRLRYFTTDEPFRSKYIYNNFMYMLAGYVAEIITGKSWETLLKQRILRPLKMTSSLLVSEIETLEGFALPHMSFNNSLKCISPDILAVVSPADPAGGICSTARDMAQWLLFVVNKGLDQANNELLRFREFKELLKPQLPTNLQLGKKTLKKPIFPVSEGRFAYDMGWGSGTYRGFHNVQHPGRINGYDSLIWVFPDSDIGIFTSTNGPMNDESYNGLRALHYYISDILLKEKVWLNHTTACTFPNPWMSDHEGRRPASHKADTAARRSGNSLLETMQKLQYVSDIPLRQYAGTYGHLAFGNITVTYNTTDDLLYISQNKYFRARLYPLHGRHRFYMKLFGPLKFWTSADGWSDRIPLYFKSSGGNESNIQTLVAVHVDASAKPEFHRGLKWDSLPIPTTIMPGNPCGFVSHACHSVKDPVSALLQVLVLFSIFLIDHIGILV